MNAERLCVLALIALTIALALMAPATTTALEKADANTINSATAQSIDDTLYLRRGAPNNLTTAGAPTGTTAVVISLGVGTHTRWWVNGTTTGNWQISGGKYNFTFWMSGPGDVTISFAFGYIKEGKEHPIVESTGSTFSPKGSVAMYSITADGEPNPIPSGSNLYLKVTFVVSDGTIEFRYDGYGPGPRPGADWRSRIITPTISAVVPEFPSGTSLLLPLLLIGYFALRGFKRKSR